MTVVLFDVDNTLLDNDTVEDQLHDHLDRRSAEPTSARATGSIFEELRQAELGYADYLGALQRYRLEDLDDPQLLQLSEFLLDYPFADRLYPGALEAVAPRGQRSARRSILTDGDAVFQPRKVRRSGLWEAFGGHVLVYVHKEQMLADVERWHPADHYVARRRQAPHPRRRQAAVGASGSRRCSSSRATTPIDPDGPGRPPAGRRQTSGRSPS